MNIPSIDISINNKLCSGSRDYEISLNMNLILNYLC